MNSVDNQQGAVLLFTVLVVGFSAVAMMSVIATAGFNSFVDSDQQVNATVVRGNLYGCVDELLVQLNLDPDYSPTALDTVDAICTVSVVNEGGDNRSADLSLTQGNVTRSAHIEMMVNGVQLISMVEE
ncbi:hypothetical protein HQ487_03360 [Candidatus Uhrbacteria bacterium]|nr:hypothetical protein [Candidatus Uhrbacteria bacterium]